MIDWYLANVEANRTLNIFPITVPPTLLNDSVIEAELAGSDDSQKVVYFGAPEYYLGNYLK